MDAGEQAEQAAREQRVVEVGDDEEAAVDVVVQRRRGDDDPGQPTNQELADEAEREQHRRAQQDRAADHRRDQVEVLDPRRHRQQVRGEREVLVLHRAGYEHVVPPDGHRERREDEQRDDQRRGSRRSVAREGGDDFCNRADEGEEHHVDDRVPVEPEEVLVGDRPGGSRRRRRRGGVRRAAGPSPRTGPGRQARTMKSRRQHRPGEDRQPQHRHTGRSQADDGEQDRDRDQQGAEAARPTPITQRSIPTPGVAGAAGERDRRRPGVLPAPESVRKPEYIARPPQR